MTQSIRIMGRLKGEKKWHGLDYNGGCLVINKIHQTFWPIEHKSHVETLVKDLNRDNMEWEFKMAKW